MVHFKNYKDKTFPNDKDKTFPNYKDITFPRNRKKKIIIHKDTNCIIYMLGSSKS